MYYLLGEAVDAFDAAENAMQPRKAFEAVVAQMNAADGAAAESGGRGGSGRSGDASHAGAVSASMTLQAAQAASERMISSTTWQRILDPSRAGDLHSRTDAALAAQGGRVRNRQCPDHLTIFGIVGYLRSTADSCDLHKLGLRRDKLKGAMRQLDPDFNEGAFAAGRGAMVGGAGGREGRHALPVFSDDPELRAMQRALHKVNGRIDAIRNLTDAARLADNVVERLESSLALLSTLAAEPLCRSILIASCMGIVPLLLRMCRLPLDYGVKAAVLRVLAILARDADLVPSLWVAIEREGLMDAPRMRGVVGGVTDIAGGIRSEFHGPERDDNDYRASTEFCRLMRALISHREGLLVPAALGFKTDSGNVPCYGAWPYARFVVGEVLASFPRRMFASPTEKW